MKDNQTKQHGGARPGAGRPSKAGQRRTFYLAQDVCDALDALQPHGAATRFVENAVREKIKRDARHK